MTFGRVIGRVWASIKHPGLDGLRMLYVQPLTPDLKPTGRRIIVTDSTGAGTGELVYWVRGKEASFPFLPAEPPTDNTIVGIVDEVHVGPKSKPEPVPSAEAGAGQARPVAKRRG
jgi:microcompartment protein CcmK/EutM